MAGPGRLAILYLSSTHLSRPPLHTALRCLTTVGLSHHHHHQQSLCGSSLPLKQSVRHTSFFNKLPADQLWKSVTSVSNAGKKQGRGKGVGKKMAKNLNRGQIIGVGKENMVWPGLNSPILRGRELVQRQLLPRDEEREAKLHKMRDSMGRFRFLKIDPLDRGWSGTKMPGRSIGPPDPIGDDKFNGFDTKVLELKVVSCMTAVFGRKRRMSVFAVTGNGKGLVGFALSKATTIQDALRKVRNNAGQRLLYIHRYNEHTVLHDFFTQFGCTKIFVKKMPEGYGLVCHRAIRTICQVAGIKDLHAKVEGSMNVQNMTKAFILGLISQKTYQEMADEKQLYLVEQRKENHDWPQVVAAPSNGVVRTMEDVNDQEEKEMNTYLMKGKVRLQKKKYVPFFANYPSYHLFLKRYSRRRNNEKVKIQMRMQEGEVRSFYTDKYPECRPGPLGDTKRLEQEEQM